MKSIFMPDSIVMRDVDDLLPYARNSRTHSAEQIAKIAASIKEFGWTIPVLVDGEGTLVAGHGRLEAARKLNLKAVPTIEVTHLTEAQRRAYIIADNRLALDAGWDMDMLRIEVEDLQSLNFDIGLTGLSEAELDSITKDVQQIDYSVLEGEDAADGMLAGALKKAIIIEFTDLDAYAQASEIMKELKSSGADVSRVVLAAFRHAAEELL